MCLFGGMSLKKEEKVFHLETSVFPLLDVKESMNGMPKTIEYKGTCFLILMGQQHIFVTAKHLLSETTHDHNLYLASNTPKEIPSLLKVDVCYVNHLKQDISFFFPSSRMKAEYEHLLVPMGWLRHRLSIGQGVFGYGFPNSVQQDTDDTIPIFNVQRTKYEGHELCIDNDCLLPSMKTIYQLDIPSPRGLSGSPVMVVHRNTVAVAGYIIGEQSIDGMSVATAANFTPFVEIERLLIDVSQRQESKSN